MDSHHRRSDYIPRWNLEDHELDIEYSPYPVSAPLWFFPDPMMLASAVVLSGYGGMLIWGSQPVAGFLVGVGVAIFVFGWWLLCRLSDSHSFFAWTVPGSRAARKRGCTCPNTGPGPERVYDLDPGCPSHKANLDQEFSRQFQQSINRARHKLDLEHFPHGSAGRRERYEGYDWGANDSGDGGG